jgi:hypothetical protein
MMLMLAVLMSIQVVQAQDFPQITIQWEEVVAQEDGTPIDADDLIYTVRAEGYAGDVCSTSDVACTVTPRVRGCGTIYAVASQISTRMESARSNSIYVCSDDFANRLNSPVLKFIIGSR